MNGLKQFAFAQVHVYSAGQARIEAADRTHNIDSFESVRTIILKNRRVLDAVFIGTRSAIHITGTGVPWRRRVRMVVGDLSVADHHVMRQNATNRLVEAATDRVVRYLEIGPRSNP